MVRTSMNTAASLRAAAEAMATIIIDPQQGIDRLGAIFYLLELLLVLPEFRKHALHYLYTSSPDIGSFD
jgi:hypothetical protein